LLNCRWALCAVVLVAGLVACGNDDDTATPTAPGDDAITVGSFDFAESVLLAEIYSQALESRGIRVERSFGLGPREFVAPALRKGLVELVPEYAGTALGFFSLGTVEPSSDANETAQALETALHGSGVAALSSGSAQDANTFVVSRDTALRYHLRTLSDLAPVADELVFGGPAECPVRPLCLIGLGERYGLTFDEVVTLDAGGAVTHQALDSGSVDVALLFTTDPTLGDYVELIDDMHLQPAETVTPLVTTDVLERWGADVVEPLEQVSQHLTTEHLRTLNAADGGEAGSADVAAIAAEWLQTEGVT
jgi:osmoprotectant transport system substrate-binding protein